MKYFRVKIGYGRDEFISVDETEVEKAIRAQITGVVAILKEGSISGNHIISITPDFQREMGWARDYQLGAEDYAEIGSRRRNEYQLALDIAMQEAKTKLSLREKNGRPQLSSGE